MLQLSWDYETELEHKDAFTSETATLDGTQLARMNEAIRTLQDNEVLGTELLIQFAKQMIAKPKEAWV
ncbi:hypothetical protein D2Q93_13580 [Alicyclobacillaceae bacterium I2511]|nr:hypothetical protein D2Q93_13580 [Alicyclobacillaceae bacterium I2511]